MDGQITRCNQIIDPAWSSNHDMWLFDLQFFNLTAFIRSSNIIYNPNLFVRMTSDLTSSLVNLRRQLPTRSRDDRFYLLAVFI